MMICKCRQEELQIVGMFGDNQVKKVIEFCTMVADFMIVNDEQKQDLSNFMIVPDIDDEKCCYDAFYDATSNDNFFSKCVQFVLRKC